MNYIEQNEEEQQQEPHINENENNAEIKKEDNFDIFKNEILKTINKLSENFNQELKKQNDFFISQQNKIKEEHENKINELENKLKIIILKRI